MLKRRRECESPPVGPSWDPVGTQLGRHTRQIKQAISG